MKKTPKYTIVDKEKPKGRGFVRFDTKFGNKTIPAVIELISTSKKGNKTIVIYSDAKFDIEIDKKMFSRKNLRKRI